MTLSDIAGNAENLKKQSQQFDNQTTPLNINLT